MVTASPSNCVGLEGKLKEREEVGMLFSLVWFGRINKGKESGRKN